MRGSILAAVIALSLGAPALAQDAATARGAPPRVALVVVGSDAKSAGALGRSLESRLVALPQLRLRTGEQSVAVLAPASAGEIAASDPLGVRVSEALPLIARAFYDEDLKKAESLLAAAEAARGRSTLARLRLLLWKAAIADAKNDKAGAVAAVKEALALAPDVEADGRIHPPSLQDLLDAHKPKTGRSASLAVLAYPPGAVVRIDDRLAEGRVAVTPGKHLVVVTSRGWRPVEATVTVTGDATVTVSLPVAYASDAELAAFAGGGGPGAAAALASKLEVETVLVVSTEPARPLRVNVHGPTPAPAPATTFPDDAAGQAALADWIEARFKPEIALRPDLRAWTVTATAGPVFGARQRSLSAGADRLDATFAGFGPGLSLRVAPGRWRFEADAAQISYALGRFEADFPDGSRASVGGGETLAVRVAAGWAFGAGRTGREDRAEIAPGVALTWERHAAEDLSDERGTLGFLPSHERMALALGGQASFPLGRMGAGPARLVARVAVVPLSTWEETPAGSSGRRPRADTGFDGALAVTWEPGRWLVTAGAQGELRTVRFRGEADLPADPPLDGARLREGVQLFTLTFGRSF